MNSAEELHHARQVQKNIVATLDTLNKCIPGKKDNTATEREREYVSVFDGILLFLQFYTNTIS